MKKIHLDTSIYDLTKEYPEIKEIMIELGFKTIAKAALLESVGKIMTLRKGSLMKKIEISFIISVFAKHGFLLED